MKDGLLPFNCPKCGITIVTDHKESRPASPVAWVVYTDELPTNFQPGDEIIDFRPPLEREIQ